MSELTKWINDLAGEYVESWVVEQVAEEWQKDKDRIAELEDKLVDPSYSEAYSEGYDQGVLDTYKKLEE